VSLAILDPKGWPAVVDVDMAGAPRIHAENLAPSPVVQTPRRPVVSRVIHLPTRIHPAPSRHSEA